MTLGLLLFLAGMTAQSALAAGHPAKLRVLILSGLNNHHWRSTTPVIQKTFTDCPRFGTVDITEDPANLSADTLARYDVLVSNWTPYPDTRRTWRPEAEHFNVRLPAGRELGLAIPHSPPQRKGQPS